MWACFCTAQNTKIWSFIKTTMCFICFTRRCCSLSYSSFSTWTSRQWGCIYALCSPQSFRTRLSFFFAPITTFAILTLWQWDRSRRYSTENDKQDVLIAFLSGTHVCTQATPLIAFLNVTNYISERDKLHSWASQIAFLNVTNCIPERDKLHSWAWQIAFLSVTPHPSALQDW